MRKAIIFIAAITTATPVLADQWRVTEGPLNNPVNSNWDFTIDKGVVNGFGQIALITGHGVTFRLTGSMTGNMFYIQTQGRGPIDACTYRGSTNKDDKTSDLLDCGPKGIKPISIIMLK